MIEPDNMKISIRRQCMLFSLSRSAFYRKPKLVSGEDIRLMNAIDEIYTKWPFYGSRRMKQELLKRVGMHVNRKRLQRLMRLMGLEAIYPKPNLSRRNNEDSIYPYLLRDLAVTHANQVWASDITYIRTVNGFVYLTVIQDWFSRKVLSWRLSNTLDSAFCVEALEEALRHHGPPEIFNTDQGSQYTSAAFTRVLLDHGVRISMDGKGRALDNVFVERLWRSVKYEDIYIKAYETMMEVKIGLRAYFVFYNETRVHQGLAYRTPDDVYFNRGAEKCAA